MADVFISYKSRRRDIVEQLARVLELNGYSVWYDRALVAGEGFSQAIERELRAARAVVVAWCSLSVTSDWVREEASLAKRLCTMIPVRLERVEVPLGFGTLQSIDLSAWDGAPRSHLLDQLLLEVARLVGRDPVPQVRELMEFDKAWRRAGGSSRTPPAGAAGSRSAPRGEASDRAPAHEGRATTQTGASRGAAPGAVSEEATVPADERRDPASACPAPAAATGAPDPVPALPDGPSIAVLPFAFMGDAGTQDWLADGITEDITTDLARLRWLFVIARNSTFTYKGRAVDVREVARDLGVRYVLEGSVRVAGGRIRVTGQLVDAGTGRHIWAERYDRELSDIFAVQDEITRNVVAAIEPHLYAEEGYRAAARPTGNLSAWGLAVRAMGLISRVGRQQNEEARRLLEAAIALEPHYARAHAVLAWSTWWAALCYWWPDNADGYRMAARQAEKAVALDPAEPWARMTHGICLSTMRQHEAGLAELRAALDLNPSFALGRTLHGWGLLRAGRMEEAIEQTGLALRMSPMDSFAGIYTSIHGLALLGARRFEQALPHLRASVAAFAEYFGHYNTLISCCGHLGRIEEARDYIAARNRIDPPIRVGVLRKNLAGFAHADIFIEGLVKAGVPE